MSELILPMLAKPFKLKGAFPRETFAVEEKLDGHRIMVRVVADENGCKGIKAWAREGRIRKLPIHLVGAFCDMPVGLYDGELMAPSGKSWDVTRVDLHDKLTYALFDVLEVEGNSMAQLRYDDRREALRMINTTCIAPHSHIILTASSEVNTADEMKALVNSIWARGGEGIIIKRRSAHYSPGRRTDAFMKLKTGETSVLTIMAWEAGTTGDYCVAVVHDADGNRTKVKVRDDATRARVKANPESFIGRLLRIEYVERTPDGSYRHPRWDRLEDE